MRSLPELVTELEKIAQRVTSACIVVGIYEETRLVFNQAANPMDPLVELESLVRDGGVAMGLMTIWGYGCGVSVHFQSLPECRGDDKASQHLRDLAEAVVAMSKEHDWRPYVVDPALN